MTIECDHPRPKLDLPQLTPPQLGWQVPSYLSPDDMEFRRQVLEALQGIYLEQSKRFATPAILPLFDVEYDLGPGQVVKGVANGQTLNLLPSAVGSGAALDPVTVILTAVESPVQVVSKDQDGATVTALLSSPGAYTFMPDNVGGYAQPPGDILVGSGGPTYTLQVADPSAPNAYVATASSEIVPTYDDGPPRLLTWLISAASIALSKLADITGPTFLGRLTGTGAPETLTGTQATTMLDPFTSSLQGVVTASGGGTTNFARADGAWAAPPDTTYTAGDGLDLSGGNAFSVDVTDLVDGVSIEEVATNNIRRAALTGDVTASAGSNATTIANDVVTVAKMQEIDQYDLFARSSSGTGNPQVVGAGEGAGNSTLFGIDGFGTLGYQSGGVVRAIAAFVAGDGIDISDDTISSDVSDFAGTGLEDDGSNNLRISSSAAGGGLTGGSGSALAVASSIDTNARVGVRRNSAGSTFLRRRINLIEGSNVSINVSDDSGSEEVDVTITSTDTNTTYSAGDGIDLTGTTFSADVSDFAGGGLEDDGSNNLRRSALTGDVTASAGSNTTSIAAGVIVNNDVNASAAIAQTKLGALTGDVTKSSGGSTLSISTNTITNNMVNSSAAIDQTKLAGFGGEVTKASGASSTTIDRSTTFDWTGIHRFNSRVALNSIVNVAAGNNVTIGNANIVRITSGTTLTGMVFVADGHLVALVNATSGTVTIVKESTSSAANQFGGSSSSILLSAGNMIMCVYDGTSNRWRAGMAIH